VHALSTSPYPLADAVAQLGFEELRVRQDQVARLLDADGAVYNAYGTDDQQGQPWRLDVLPAVVTSHEWHRIETAMIERAELLSLVLEDLYGARDLLRRGLLPPEVVFGHPGFLRETDGMGGRAQSLFTYAADLGRDPAGNWVVLADRAQAPSGFGYAFENRKVIAHVLPSLLRNAAVHRLVPFFRALRAGLQEVAPKGVEDPRIVVLTPGPWNETAFEHALLANMLGYPLVEGADLVCRADGVWMRLLGTLEPVHVILRRVDADFCDPLELRPESRLGTPGLIEATRRGAVTIVNPLGSAALENPALMRFLPAISRHLTGADLDFPSVGTWWCGIESERDHVLKHLDRLVLRPLTGAASVFGSHLSQAELDDLRARIDAHPAQWVGQEPGELMTVPTLAPGGLEDRRSLLRTFAVARGGSFTVMTGGLTRVEPPENRGKISNQTGALNKDTWVLASEPERGVGPSFRPGPAVAAVDPMASLSARAAENLWWLGRYAERAESATRLLRVAHGRADDFHGSSNAAGVAALRAILDALTAVTATPADLGLRALVTDDTHPGTLAHSVRGLLQAAYAVRDQLSGDTWLVLGSLDRALADPDPTGREALQPVLGALLALAGLGEESMVRDLAWRFLDGGRRLERALQIIALLRATVCAPREEATEALVLESVVAAAESLITYRRRYRSHAQMETALELLVLDEGNPRSLAFVLNRLADDLDAIPVTARHMRTDQRIVLEALTAVRVADPAVLARGDEHGARTVLAAFLDDLAERLARAAEAVDADSFVHRLPQLTLLSQ
jgi:uncharacterized circularly permuted ATP-grasp superfamily protein/uncharacterized alpha-E superfamily protein